MTQLLPMTESDFQEFLERSIKNYAAEKIRAGTYTAENALEQAQRAFQRVIPNGLATKDNYFYMIYDEVLEQKVGLVWFAQSQMDGSEPQAFIYDVLIYEQFRRHGYAQQAFLLLEEKVHALNLSKIGLHVFGHNQAAIALYTKLGYIATDITMAKRLN